jgi:hypothetical protein
VLNLFGLRFDPEDGCGMFLRNLNDFQEDISSTYSHRRENLKSKIVSMVGWFLMPHFEH